MAAVDHAPSHALRECAVLLVQPEGHVALLLVTPGEVRGRGRVRGRVKGEW